MTTEEMLPFASSIDLIYAAVTIAAVCGLGACVYLLARTQRPAIRQPAFAVDELGGPVREVHEAIALLEHSAARA